MALALVLAGLPAASGDAARAAEPACLSETFQARAVDAEDARTLTLEDGRVLRVAGIEPFDLLRPELSEAPAELRGRMSALAGGRAVTVQLADGGPDRYGRHPALIAADGALLQETLAGEGLAIAFAGGDPLPCFQRILAAETGARAAGRGFWTETTLPGARPAALATLTGRFVIFEGKVLSVGNRSTRTYLNFGERWSEDVTVEIAAGDRAAFGGEAGLAALAGQRVRVRGFLEEKGGPMMPISSPMQLEMLDREAGEIRGEP